MIKTLASAIIAVSIILLASSLYSKEKQEKSGESLFAEFCAPCHRDGGNILNPGKTLHKRDLTANKITMPEDIVKKMRNPGPNPTHPQDWAGMKMFDEKKISNEDALKIANYILKTFK